MHESLDWDIGFRCGVCGDIQPCVKKNLIDTPPLVLTIGLKRFNSTAQKDDRPIAMPMRLNLTSFIR